MQLFGMLNNVLQKKKWPRRLRKFHQILQSIDSALHAIFLQFELCVFFYRRLYILKIFPYHEFSNAWFTFIIHPLQIGASHQSIKGRISLCVKKDFWWRTASKENFEIIISHAAQDSVLYVLCQFLIDLPLQLISPISQL